MYCNNDKSKSVHVFDIKDTQGLTILLSKENKLCTVL